MRDATSPIAYTIMDTKRVAGLGETKIYELIGAGILDARKAGRRTVIMADSLHVYLSGLPKAAVRPSCKVAA